MEKDKLIQIKQLPVIEEQLRSVSKVIDDRVKNAMSLVCTEETVKDVKKIRANMNNDFKEFETRRKEIKEKVLAPYKQFEEIYKECISDKYKSADNELKQKIDNIEKELKAEKEQEIKEYFEEYKKANNIDFITYEQANINVTLMASMKSLKEQAKQFIDRVVEDLESIGTQEYKEEILVEYKKGLRASGAITTVNNRHKLIEEEKKKQEEIVRQNLEKEKESIKKAIKPFEEVNQLQAPVEEKKEKVYVSTFKVKATKTKLKELKQFLEDGGYDYE